MKIELRLTLEHVQDAKTKARPNFGVYRAKPFGDIIYEEDVLLIIPGEFLLILILNILYTF